MSLFDLPFFEASFNIFVLLPFYIILGTFSLFQFRNFLQSAVIILKQPDLIPYGMGESFRPFLTVLRSFIESVFGSSPDALKFQVTHVILVAILFALITLNSSVRALVRK
eukprot:TRINITY_DN6080_c0_g1_i1.p1 TRINITY_DN6080_c0_g1~~TRINITY_DN6080_c0_g1_i1.p1  ORF type:complete len:110 (+),score=38.46 TRINITY_DN6080_c0_g1_i1:49-378(+)